ncbi:MAG: DUF4118 domain-containing protein [Clostridia bacterium]
MQRSPIQRWLRDTLITVGILTAAIVLCVLLVMIDDVHHGDAYVSMVFILAVLLTSRFTDGYPYGIIASLVSVLAVNYFFTYPYWAFNFSLPGYPITIICMLGVSITTSMLTSRIKQQEYLHYETECEKMRANLLRAVSHDLRTPLTSILGANSAIMENDDVLTKQQRMQLLHDVNEDAQWLIRMVENLLTITRIQQDQSVEIVKTPEATEEVVAEAVHKFHKRFPEVVIAVSVPDALLICPMDAILIEQVLINLLENAVLHAYGATSIALSVTTQGEDAVFSVTDNGCGLTKDQLCASSKGILFAPERQGDGKKNMGIGLSVCNTIVQAHGGIFQLENRASGGAIFRFKLPLKEA